MKSHNLPAWLGLFLLATAACTAQTSDPDAAGATGAEAFSLSKDELVQCKDVKGKKGELTITFEKSVKDAETKEWKKKVVPIGLRGTFDGEQLSHSQGDQPDVVSIKKDGKSYELRFLEKKCAGSCDNFAVLSSGGGEDEETTFIRLAKITIDGKDKTATIEGSTVMFGTGKPKDQSLEYTDCKVNDALIDELNDQVDPG